MKFISHAIDGYKLLKMSVTVGLIMALLFSQSVLAQNVKGVVKDVSGIAVPGAAVRVHDSKGGVSTDSLGKFTLPLKVGAVIDVSAIGFNDTSITVGGADITIVLHPRQNNLKDVTVNSGGNGAGGGSLLVVDPIAFDQIVASTLADFAVASGFSGGTTFTDGYVGRTAFHTIVQGMGAQNNINSGEMLPYYMPKGETHGSRYLFNGYVGGVVIDSGNGLIQNTAPIYNYDKIDGALLIRKDAANNIEVNKDQVKAFALKNSDTTYIFMKVPAIGANKYYIFIGAGPKYAVFRALKTTFIKSNYISNGLTESGNNYDEFVDESEYYLLSLQQKQPVPVTFVLKKKSIRQVFGADAQKVDAYFSQHKNDDIDEGFVKGLVGFIN